MDIVADGKRVLLRPRQNKQLLKGYPWVFRDQIRAVEGEPRTGDVVAIVDDSGHTHGLGLFHESSLIAIRFLTRAMDAVLDPAFFERRLARALELRRQVFGDSSHFRWVFSESDGLPGTIVDRYGDVVCWSSLCAGIDQRKDLLLDAIERLTRPTAIVERNDHWLRAKDSLPESHGVSRGSLKNPVRIEEHGLKFEVDVLEGPKTGFFLDQRIHREVIRRFANGRSVLDVFCADGGFGLNAAAGGAKSVHCVDVAAGALQRARNNAALNGFQSRMSFEECDALERLGELAGRPDTYDLVILDPPAFAKSRRHVEAATGAYQSININALRLLPEGGVLATSSCSQAIDEKAFWSIVRYSARLAGCTIRLLYRGGQPPDHPVLPSMPETHYLKFYVVQKMADELPFSSKKDEG